MSESVVSINVYCQHFYSARRPGRTINRLLLFLCRSLESFKSVSGKSSLSLHSVFPNGKHNIMILLWMVASVWKMLLILVIIFNFRLQQRSVMDWTLSLLTAFDRGSARSLILCSGSTNVGKKKKNEFADSVVIRRSLCRWVCSCSITQ